MDELINELKTVGSVEDAGDFLLMNSHYAPVEITSENFHPIDTESPIISGKKMAFVDGGNSIIFESAGLALGYIRVGYIVYRNNIRIDRNKSEFYILITEKGGNYAVRTFPNTRFNGMTFNPDDESLKNGLEKCEPSRIISVIRRLAEIEYAIWNSHVADVILLDGTLEARYPHEAESLKKLLTAGKVVAMSKTCSLTTNNGRSITKKLHDMMPGAWYYSPIVENRNSRHDAEICFVKLHDKSSHVFRFEIQKRFSANIDESLSLISRNSTDPIFLGYPYGFIDVDQYVRVTTEENSMLQTMASSKMGKEWNEFSKNLNSMNAHSILDKIRF